MCLYMGLQQCEYEQSRQESVGSSNFSHPLPPGSGYTEGPQFSPQHVGLLYSENIIIQYDSEKPVNHHSNGIARIQWGAF